MALPIWPCLTCYLSLYLATTKIDHRHARPPLKCPLSSVFDYYLLCDVCGCVPVLCTPTRRRDIQRPALGYLTGPAFPFANSPLMLPGFWLLSIFKIPRSGQVYRCTSAIQITGSLSLMFGVTVLVVPSYFWRSAFTLTSMGMIIAINASQRGRRSTVCFDSASSFGLLHWCVARLFASLIVARRAPLQ